VARSIPRGMARWGLLITTVALGIVLVGSGLLSFVSARESSDAVIQARSYDLLSSVRRQLRLHGPTEEVLEGLLADMEDQGLTYIAVVDRQGRVAAEAGERIGPLEAIPRSRGGPWEPHLTRQGDRVRAVVGARGGRRGKAGRWVKRRFQNRRLDKGPDGRATFDEGRRGLPPLRGRSLVVEFEPVVAATITSRGFVQLLVNLVAAVVLLMAAGIFFRLSRRADQMEGQLAKDLHLKALGEMSGVLGHELRNPLASLKGHAQLLLERLEEDHKGRKGAERIVKEAVRLETITNQVLDFVRTAEIQRAPADPRAVARSAIEVAGSDTVRIVGEQEIADWPMDRIRMERVLTNLLTNAEAASPEGGDIELGVTTEGAETLVYTVRDRGGGLPAGAEEWIFEPFHTKKVKGTGLGLAVARRITEAHGGGISARNHPDGGAEFRVWIPKG